MTRVLGMVLCFAATGSVLAGGESIPRSIYVPVAFRTCEHLTGASLFIADQAVGALPTERIFVFTYYPHLKRLEPQFNELRVEGVRSEDATPFIGYLAVAASAISTATERIELDFERIKQQLTYRIDGRYEKIHVVVRCDGDCKNKVPAPATALLETTSPPALVDEP